jgi:hypothetical protein
MRSLYAAQNPFPLLNRPDINRTRPRPETSRVHSANDMDNHYGARAQIFGSIERLADFLGQLAGKQLSAANLNSMSRPISN